MDVAHFSNQVVKSNLCKKIKEQNKYYESIILIQESNTVIKENKTGVKSGLKVSCSFFGGVVPK